MLMPENPSNGASRSRRTSQWALVGLAVSLLAFMIGGTSASAHTSFLGSDPTDGSTVTEPISEILVMFTGGSEEAGDGFVVRDADGELLDPVVTTRDDKTFKLSFDEPLSDGVIGVRWSVRAGDAHPIDGSFSFTVATGTAPAPTSVAAGAPPTPVADASAGDADMSTMSPEEMATMDEFLDTDQAPPGESTATLGRLISIAAIVLAIGALVFAATTLRGERGEIETLITAVRVLGAVIVVGAVIEYVGVAALADESLGAAWSTSAGFATAMRAAAGMAIALGLTATTTRVDPPTPARSLSSAARRSGAGELESDFWDGSAPVPAAERPATEPQPAPAPRRSTGSAFIDPGLALSHRLSGAHPVAPVDRAATEDSRGPGTARVSGRPTVSAEPPESAGSVRRWTPDRSSSVAAAGVVVAIVSFWFDGHTVSEGFRPLHALMNSVHVVAGAVWVGGVVALAAVLWMRHRRGRPSGALDLVVRFSSVAGVALGAVVIAGLVMAVTILDSFGDLTSTPWGQTLLLKTAAASIAMGAGAYNHFRLMPALERDPDDADLHHLVRSIVTAEAILLGFVVVVTAWLVAAAS